MKKKITKNFIKKYWEAIEKKKPPKNVKNIKIIESKNFFNAIDNYSDKSLLIKKIISNIYSGDALIIKNAISKKEIDKIKKKLVSFSDKEVSKFFKMNKKCPNFWRRQDESMAKKYSVKAIRDSYYFFRWNKKEKDIWKTFDEMWGNLKFLGGLQKNSFIKNVPKDGVIDRVQIVRYPENTGYIEPHFHNPKHQRLIISIYMSKKGIDYKGGGTCFYKGKKMINIESRIDVGDIGVFYATLKHSVNPVKKTNNKIRKKFRGRWWCGLYSPESDLKKNRQTSSPSK